MRNLVLALSITVALLAGCIIGATASQLVVPPVKAGNGTQSIQKWEYKCFSDDDVDDIEKKGNLLGRAGFELAGAAGAGGGYDPRWCFKRRLP